MVSEFKPITKWYYTLHGSPDSLFPLKASIEKDKRPIIAEDYQIEGETVKRFLPLFDSYPELIKTITDHCERGYTLSWYETIPASRKRKFYLDIDITPSNPAKLETLKNKVMSTLFEKLQELWPELTGRELILEKDVALWSSHGEKKVSFHIIFPQFMLSNKQESKDVFKFIQDRLPPTIHNYIDSSVYSDNQNFRLPLSTKLGQNRIKKPVPFWKFGKIECKGYLPPTPGKDPYDFMDRFERGFASCVLSDSLICCINRPFTYGVKESIFKKIEEERLQKTHHLYTILPDPPHPPEGFEISGVIQSTVTLKRVSTSFCPICNREHEHENAYFTYHEPSSQWFFHCHRSFHYVGDNKGIPYP